MTMRHNALRTNGLHDHCELPLLCPPPPDDLPLLALKTQPEDFIVESCRYMNRAAPERTRICGSKNAS